MQGAETHQIDGSLEHRCPIQGEVTGEPKGHVLVAADYIPLETRVVQIVSTTLTGEQLLAAAAPAHEQRNCSAGCPSTADRTRRSSGSPGGAMPLL